jgi:hypothetical protein
MSQLPAAGRVAGAVVVAAIAAVTTACSGSSSSPQATATTPPAVATPTCPPVAASPGASADTAKILRNVPFDLPMPGNMTYVASRTTNGIRVVQFSTPNSLRDSVLFIVKRYQAAGYVLARGDAEATEADAPWAKTSVRGLTRVTTVGDCQTRWLVASVATKTGGSNSPLLRPHPTSSVTSPLPFG